MILPLQILDKALCLIYNRFIKLKHGLLSKKLKIRRVCYDRVKSYE